MFMKNKKLMSLTLGLAMVYGVGTMSAFASPKTEIPEMPPFVQDQDEVQPPVNGDFPPAQDHDKDQKKTHKKETNHDKKRPLPPREENKNANPPVPNKKHLDDAQKPLPPECDEVLPDAPDMNP